MTERGVCWNTEGTPEIIDFRTKEGTGAGSFTSQLSGLESQTTYYVRVYATNEIGTAYGSIDVFETEKGTTGTINGHGYVDLGLPSGLRRATCNVGADNPEDYGDYFAWGEADTKSEYTEDNSQTYGLSTSELQAQGILDEDCHLTPQYEAATANWGSSWRMPTWTELWELMTNCSWIWTVQNGVNGYVVISRNNGNRIFLPAAGYRYGSSLYNAGEYGLYWCSDKSMGLFFYDGTWAYDSQNCYFGFTVRPVTE